MSIISNNIKYLRRLNGLTQEQFSRRIGIKRSLLGAYEEARANPNYDNLQTIAKIFGISIDELLKNDMRRIRNTPDLLSQSSSAEVEPTYEAKRDEEPKPLAEILEKFLHDPPIQESKPSYSEKINTEAKKVEVENSFQQQEVKYQPNHDLSNRIPVVKQHQISSYLQKYAQQHFIEELPTIDLPYLQNGNYRAFEAGADFAFSGALLIGKNVGDWKNIQDGKNYILVLRQQGFVYRRVYNQIKIKGSLLLSADNLKFPTIEIGIKEIVEIWECVAFVSTDLPQPSLSIEKMKVLTEELRSELDRMK